MRKPDTPSELLRRLAGNKGEYIDKLVTHNRNTAATSLQHDHNTPPKSAIYRVAYARGGVQSPCTPEILLLWRKIKTACAQG